MVSIARDLEAGLRAWLTEAQPTSIAVFTGRDSYGTSGAADVVEAVLGPLVRTRIAVGSPPTVESVRAALGEYLVVRPDAVLAIGGGAVLDIAKSVAMFAAQDDPADLTLRSDWQPVTTPIVAVPTTAGSGSEATPFAVLYVGNDKHSLYDPSLLPQRVVLDPRLIASVGPAVAAAAGLDVLAHCIESMWSTRATPESIDRAEETLRAVVMHLVPSVVAPSFSNDNHRSALQRAAYDAGTCIAVTRTTAAHALSYYATLHHEVRHGHAAALTLGRVLEFNAAVTDATCQDHRGAAHVQTVIDRIADALGVTTPDDAAGVIDSLIRDVGLPVGLRNVGIGADEIAPMATSANPERLATNPRRTGLDELVDIVKRSA